MGMWESNGDCERRKKGAPGLNRKALFGCLLCVVLFWCLVWTVFMGIPYLSDSIDALLLTTYIFFFNFLWRLHIYIYILLKCVPFSNPREYSKIGDLTLTTLFWSPSPYSHLVTCKKGCHSVQIKVAGMLRFLYHIYTGSHHCPILKGKHKS